MQLSNDHNLVEQLKGTVKNQKGDITLLRDELEKEKKRVQDQWYNRQLCAFAARLIFFSQRQVPHHHGPVQRGAAQDPQVLPGNLLRFPYRERRLIVMKERNLAKELEATKSKLQEAEEQCK